jgi:hypothetical protein
MAESTDKTILSFKAGIALDGHLEGDDFRVKAFIKALLDAGFSLENNEFFLTYKHACGSSTFGPVVKVEK